MIKAENLCIGFDKQIIVPDFSFELEKGEILSILGPNGSGKSTVLNAVAKFIKMNKGVVYLDKKSMENMSVKETAQKMSTLSQHNSTPADFTVKELIYYGRLPHKKWYETKSDKDDEIIEWAMEQTSVTQFAEKRVTELSGGEKQRVFIALALAQEPKILMLDEPTTYLDVCHQIEVLELVKELNQKLGLSIVMVLHDLAQAGRYSDRVIVIKKGNIVVDGKPEDVLTKELIKEVYNVDAYITNNEEMGGFTIVPISVFKN